MRIFGSGWEEQVLTGRLRNFGRLSRAAAIAHPQRHVAGQAISRAIDVTVLVDKTGNEEGIAPGDQL